MIDMLGTVVVSIVQEVTSIKHSSFIAVLQYYTGNAVKLLTISVRVPQIPKAQDSILNDWANNYCL